MFFAKPAQSFFFTAVIALSIAALPAQNMSTAGERMRELNNELLRIHGDMQQISPDQWEALREEAAPVLEQRFAALSEMIQRKPREALKFAFSPELVDDLTAKFPQLVSRIEKHGTWQGPVERWVIDYSDMKSSREVLQMKVGQQNFEVHFAEREPAGLKSGDVLEVTGVQVGSMLAASSGTIHGSTLSTETEHAVHGTTHRFSTMATTQTTSRAMCSTTGVQNTAVLLVTFPGVTPPSSINISSMNTMFFGEPGPSLTDYWNEASYGQTSAAGNVTGWYTLSGSYGCSNISQFIADSMSAAAAAGVDFNTYNRVVIVFSDMSPSCGWAGLSSIGCYNVSTASGTFNASTSVLVWNNLTTLNDIGLQVISHECGHQLGLAHSRLRTFTDSYGSLPLGALGTTGTLYEYADHFSVMGFAGGYLGHYGAGHKAELLNWLPSSDYQVIQGSGTYTIQPYETNLTGLKALKIQRGTGNNAWLWVEYRQKTGLYDSTLPNAQVYTGALIHYEDSITLPQTDLLDFTASSTYSDDPTLAVGQTWTDPYTNLSISVLSATSTGLTVSVNYGAVPCTPANPTVTASPLDPTIYAGNSMGYNLSVTNNDSAGCSASTFNLGSTQPSGWPTSFSASAVTLSPGQSGSVTMTKTGPSGTPAGTYAVNANAISAANGAYTGSGSANVTVMSAPTMTVTVSVPSTSYTRKGTVSITANVANGGTPVSGASVTFTMTPPNGSTATQSATTNRKGTATWSYKLNSNSPTGTYSAVAQASASSTGTSSTQSVTSNTVTFSVQ
jgi:M6 family metalloprotease-like protein